MGWTLTYTFPVQYVGDDTLQLIIVFEHLYATANFSYTAAEKNLRIIQYDRLEMSYDLEDALLVPSKFSFVIGDADGELNEVFFGPTTKNTATDKQATCTLKVNGVDKFIGKIIEDSVEYDAGTSIIKFDAAPQTDIINKRMVFNENGTPLNPFSYTSTSYYSIIQILEDIFGLVNPDISYPASLEIIHDWQFQGKKDSGDGNTINNFVFQELLQLIDPLFFDSGYGISTCGDVLKKLAVDWCGFTGLISYNKAFFKKLFYYNASNLQTVIVHSWVKNYRYGLIDYVKLTTGISSPNEPYTEGVFTELENRYLVKKTLPGFWEGGGNAASNVKGYFDRANYFAFFVDGSLITTFPTENDTYSNNGSTFRVVGINETNDSTSKITALRISGVNNPQSAGNLTRISGSGDATIAFASWNDPTGYYTIRQTRDPNILNNAFGDHGDIMAKFWFKYRGDLQNCRVDKFRFKGINYDFLKDFNYNGSKYQPVGMTFFYSEGVTECEAVYLGELE